VVADTPKSSRKKGKLDTSEVTRKGKKNNIQDEWKPPSGSWENEIVAIDTIEESFDAEKGENLRFAYIIWNNGRKTRHNLAVLNQKCPQKVCIKTF
jgi:chromobox protein 1